MRLIQNAAETFQKNKLAEGEARETRDAHRNFAPLFHPHPTHSPCGIAVRVPVVSLPLPPAPLQVLENIRNTQI
jgi:hypothetical protein